MTAKAVATDQPDVQPLADDNIVTLDTAALELQVKQAQQGVLAAQAAVTNAKD